MGMVGGFCGVWSGQGGEGGREERGGGDGGVLEPRCWGRVVLMPLFWVEVLLLPHVHVVWMFRYCDHGLDVLRPMALGFVCLCHTLGNIVNVQWSIGDAK